jgi:hypothetical protein
MFSACPSAWRNTSCYMNMRSSARQLQSGVSCPHHHGLMPLWIRGIDIQKLQFEIRCGFSWWLDWGQSWLISSRDDHREVLQSALLLSMELNMDGIPSVSYHPLTCVFQVEAYLALLGFCPQNFVLLSRCLSCFFFTALCIASSSDCALTCGRRTPNLFANEIRECRKC